MIFLKAEISLILFIFLAGSILEGGSKLNQTRLKQRHLKINNSNRPLNDSTKLVMHQEKKIYSVYCMKNEVE